MIKQKELQYVVFKRKEIASVVEGLALPKAELKDAEAEVLSKLKKGEKVESGLIQVILNRSEKKYPPWKAILERLKGKAFIVRVTEKTKSTVTETLIVDYVVTKEAKG